MFFLFLLLFTSILCDPAELPGFKPITPITPMPLFPGFSPLPMFPGFGLTPSPMMLPPSPPFTIGGLPPLGGLGPPRTKTFDYSTGNELPGNELNSTMPPMNFTLNPEAIMNVPEIINYWGYSVEIHNVVTEDGYILQLHRIPHGKNNKNVTSKPVIFLQHGLLCTSSIWLLNLPHQSPGFIFADEGFDVWLGNARGNVYSKEHVNLPNTGNDFWRFSWDEMARYDLPASINYVLKKTNQSQLYYIGHSQGTLTMFAQLAQSEQLHKKIRKFFALAPVGRMAHVQGMFHYLGEIYDQFNLVYQIFGDNEFLSNNIFTRLLTDIMCADSSKNPICENFIFSVSGPNSNQFNSTRIGIYLAHNPAGTSARNMVHYAQMVKSKRMSKFSRGINGNIKQYGTPVAPEYDLRNISVPMYLYYSEYDWLANPKDVEEFLLKTLPKKNIKVTKKLYEFNHNDFLWGLRARKEIYEPIASIIKLDRRRLDIQEGLKKYFENKPSNISEGVRKEFVKQLNGSLEFD